MTLLAVAATTPAVFWVAAVLAGLCMGSSQSAGRAMAGLFAPAHRLAEFYGLWTFAVRLSAIVGPITYGLVTLATGGNHRIAILSTGCSSWPVSWFCGGSTWHAAAPQPRLATENSTIVLFSVPQNDSRGFDA